MIDLSSRRSRTLWLGAIIALGILSRLLHTGITILDKYLGDALYAAMVYVILRFLRRRASAAMWATVAMVIIEVFQLSMIPAHMLTSQHWIVRICARLLGTEFRFLDLLAYSVGIAAFFVAEVVPVERAKGKSR